METFTTIILPILSVIIGVVSATIADLFIEKKREKKNKILTGKDFVRELIYYKKKFPYKNFSDIKEVPEIYKKGLPINDEFDKFLKLKTMKKSDIKKIIYEDLYTNRDEAEKKLKEIEDKLNL